MKNIFERCEKKLKFTYSPGLHYCRGVYNRYLGEINVKYKYFITFLSFRKPFKNSQRQRQMSTTGQNRSSKCLKYT